MGNYRINVENFILKGNYLDLAIRLIGENNLYYPRISVCFAGDGDNRILPMDLKSVNCNVAEATGIFDLSSLFLDNRDIKSVRVAFLFSDAHGDSIIIEPDKELVIPIKRMSAITKFIHSSFREKSKILMTRLFNFLFLPYRRLPVKENQIAFISNRADRLTGNIKAVFHEMTKLDNVEIYVLCRKGGLGKNIPNIFRFFKLYATSRVVFVDDYYHMLTYVKKKKEVTLIQLWHACGAFKTVGFSRLGRDSYLRQSSANHRQYDYVVVSSQDVIPYYAEGFGVAIEKVLPLGSPRCDVLENESYKAQFRKKFYAAHPELKSKRLMMFAPTFRGGGLGSCNYPMEKFEVDRILENIDDDWVIISKMHPYLTERPIYSRANSSRVYEFSNEYDINDLLLVTDLVITDYSSVIFEASIVNVPMLFFAFDLNEYSRDRDFYCNFASFVPGKIVFTTDEIISSINDEDYSQELIGAFKYKYFGANSGHATDNVITFTRKLLGQD